MWKYFGKAWNYFHKSSTKKVLINKHNLSVVEMWNLWNRNFTYRRAGACAYVCVRTRIRNHEKKFHSSTHHNNAYI
jgi:hypothetical protein